MFLIHKHCLVQKYIASTNSFERILATDVKEGDVLRGYDVHNLKYTKHRVASKVNVPARIIELKTTSFEKVIISETSYLASTRGPWHFRCVTHGVKLFKKNPLAGSIHTPKPISTSFGDIAPFVSLAMSETDATLLADDYVYVQESWDGQQIKGKSDNNLKTSVVTRLNTNES